MISERVWSDLYEVTRQLVEPVELRGRVVGTGEAFTLGPSLIDEVMHRRTTDRATTLERACEQAIQGGTCGVRVRNHPNGTVTAEVDPTVPYGYIFECG